MKHCIVYIILVGYSYLCWNVLVVLYCTCKRIYCTVTICKLMDSLRNLWEGMDQFWKGKKCSRDAFWWNIIQAKSIQLSTVKPEVGHIDSILFYFVLYCTVLYCTVQRPNRRERWNQKMNEPAVGEGWRCDDHSRCFK